MKAIYIAAYHQSAFGKLFDLSVPAIIERAVMGACREIAIDPSAIDVGSIAAACNFTLNEQGLLAGLMASVPGLESKPIEAVENACASGGQAVLSVVQKLQLGVGEVGIAVGYEKMHDAAGKMDGKLVGKVLGYFSHPDEREGKVFVFPHLFAEVMASYLAAYGVTARDLAAIAVTEYRNARFNPGNSTFSSELGLGCRSSNRVRANQDFRRDAESSVQFSDHLNRQRSTPI